jgi:hypothetical protein
LPGDSAEQLDTFTITVATRVNLSHAPTPTNADERLVFRQLFPTLMRLDCQGALRPALAESWQADSTGRFWTFVIRDGIRSLDGSSVTARMVEADWQKRSVALQSAGLVSARALDDRTLVVTMRDLGDSLPQVFADPLWSVVTGGPDGVTGTRIAIPSGSNQPVREIVASSTGDMRDALDAGADLVLTGDPQVIDYVARRPEFKTFSLPWDHTYVFLQHPGTEPLHASLTDSVMRQSLARDAVQTDARPAESWWTWRRGCPMISTTMELPIPRAGRIAYQRTDPVARQLAERIVALAAEDPPLTAVAVPPEQFAGELQHGNDRGYIVALPLRSASPCRELLEWSKLGHLEPLIDTRQRAIVRRGSPALTTDYDGSVRVVPSDVPLERAR